MHRDLPTKRAILRLCVGFVNRHTDPTAAAHTPLTPDIVREVVKAMCMNGYMEEAVQMARHVESFFPHCPSALLAAAKQKHRVAPSYYEPLVYAWLTRHSDAASPSTESLIQKHILNAGHSFTPAMIESHMLQVIHQHLNSLRHAEQRTQAMEVTEEVYEGDYRSLMDVLLELHYSHREQLPPLRIFYALMDIYLYHQDGYELRRLLDTVWPLYDALAQKQSMDRSLMNPQAIVDRVEWFLEHIQPVLPTPSSSLRERSVGTVVKDWEVSIVNN